MVLLYVAWLEPPRPMGLLLALISTTFAPSSAAALATVRPPVPAPTTTMSASTVSAMSVMGASGTSKLPLAEVGVGVHAVAALGRVAARRRATRGARSRRRTTAGRTSTPPIRLPRRCLPARRRSGNCGVSDRLRWHNLSPGKNHACYHSFVVRARIRSGPLECHDHKSVRGSGMAKTWNRIPLENASMPNRDRDVKKPPRMRGLCETCRTARWAVRRTAGRLSTRRTARWCRPL